VCARSADGLGGERGGVYEGLEYKFAVAASLEGYLQVYILHSNIFSLNWTLLDRSFILFDFFILCELLGTS
jgi:hypothetical protein